MKILVTGGAGFIGSHLVKTLIKDGHTVVAIDNFNNYYNPEFKRENIEDIKNKNFTLLNLDITKPFELKQSLKNYSFDKVVHLAASVGVRYSLINPALYTKTNVEGTLNVLNIVRDLGVKDFILASSSSVYGNDSIAPFKENSLLLKPISPYAKSKLTAELICYAYHKTYAMNITIHRFFTVFGPHGRPDMAPYIFTKALLEGDPIMLFGDGKASRDFTYVGDIINGIVLSIRNPFPYEIFNLGSASPVSMITFVETLEKVTGRRAKIKLLDRQVGDVRHTHADITKARRLLNFQNQTTLGEGINAFVEWYKKYRL